MKTKVLLLLSAVLLLSFSCKRTVYVDELEQRGNGRYYKAGEDKPYSGKAKSDAVNADWEYRSGTQVHSNSYYENGKKKFENGREGSKTQYYDPQGNPISSEEYGKKYTPSQGYK